MDQNEPRGQVIRRLRRRRDFVGMLVAYVVVNLFLVGVWVFTSHDGDFWPIWPILGWGVGLAFLATMVEIELAESWNPLV
jgi:hypothetical protein